MKNMRVGGRTAECSTVTPLSAVVNQWRAFVLGGDSWKDLKSQELTENNESTLNYLRQ